MNEILSQPACIVVPKTWAALLAIEDFESLPKYPEKFRPTAADEEKNHEKDPTPYRDDSRGLTTTIGDFHIVLNLISGDNNYWLNWGVFKKDHNADNFDEATPVYEFAEPFFDIPSMDRIKVSTGEEITVAIQLQD